MMSAALDDKKAVVSQYSAKAEVSLAERHKKPNQSVLALTNWIKATLINNHTNQKAMSILDLGCGKGSDSLKFSFVGTQSYLGIDLCKASIAAGEQRLKQASAAGRGSTLRSSLRVGDFTELEALHLGKYAVVSAFLSLHYSFQSKETALQVLRNISDHLLADGLFLGVIPDGDKIYQELQNHRHRDLFKVEWGQALPKNAFGSDGLGLRYLFSLQSSFNQIPEYALPFSLFIDCAKQAGFKLLTSSSFKDFYESLETGSSDSNLLKRMNRGQDLLLSAEELELAEIYRTYVFQKI